MKPNIFSIILYVGTAITAVALLYGSLLNPTIAWSVGICVAIGVVVYAWRFLPAPKKATKSEAVGPETRSTATSAAVVVAVIFGLMLIVPTVVLWIGRYSPELGALFGAIALMSIFLILWLRSRYQQSRNGE